jgi:V-type H+-transporting ATPase subunit E
MTAFIRQEALEKAREIQLKADEEFAIEKSKLVREEIASIDSSYEKKFKQASMSQQITRSTMANKTRIKVLSARQELLDKLFEEARKKLADTGSKSKNYEEVLKGLILEGMYMLAENKVTLRCRKADKEKVQNASKKASAEYKEKMGSESTAVVDEKDWLPADSYVSTRSVVWNCHTDMFEQSRRRVHHRLQREDRAKQHIRGETAHARGRCSPHHQKHLIRRE